MLRGRFESAGERSPADLRSQYDDLLAETIAAVGAETVTEESGVDSETVAALAAGESPELTVEEAAAILATDADLPDADAIAAEARDILLMGMSMAVLDVEAIEAGLDDELEPKEIHGKVEGRYPMSLDEYAMVHRYIEREKR
jgi:hypothetical protein